MRRNKVKGRIAAAVSVAMLLGLASRADAAMVAYQDTGFVHGSQVSYSSAEFTIADAGTYQATLKDFIFPEPLDKLGLIITTGGTQELGRIDLGPNDKVGSFTFHADPGTYDASFYGLAGPALQLGLYGVRVALDTQVGGTSGTPAPVPLPPSLVLLGTAVLAFSLAGRRRPGVGAGPAAA